MSTQWNRIRFLTAAVVLALLVSALAAAPAFADDGIPPPTDTGVTDAPPVEEVVTETAPIQETPPTQDAAIADLPAAVPEATQMVVTDAAGEALPLATQAAAQAIIDGDPRWCPVGVSPSSGVGCTATRTSLDDTINDLIALDPARAGVIWISSAYDKQCSRSRDYQFSPRWSQFRQHG